MKENTNTEIAANTENKTFEVHSISANPTPEQLFQAFSNTHDKVTATEARVQELTTSFNELQARYARLNITMFLGFIGILILFTVLHLGTWYDTNSIKQTQNQIINSLISQDKINTDLIQTVKQTGQK